MKTLLKNRSPSPRALPIPPPWPHDAEALKAVEETVVYSEVSPRDDRSHPRPCLIRFLTENDLETAGRLYDFVLSRLPHPHILRRADDDYLQRHISLRGRCIGAFCGHEMVAFTVLAFPRDDPDNLGVDLGFGREERQHSCHFELSGVHPDYRGNHLHQTMNGLRAAFAGAAGYYHLYGTVSPRNPYSLSNHFADGMAIRKLGLKYGGMDRYIIYRRHGHRHMVTSQARACLQQRLCLDIAGQKELLAKGYWGVEATKAENGEWCVGYVPGHMVEIAEGDGRLS